MYMIGVFCLVATAVALPVLPDPPSLPESSVTVQERRLHTNVPEVVEVKQKEKKDDNDEKEYKVIPLPFLPSPPELPLLEEFIYKNLRMNDEELPIKLESVHQEEGEKDTPEPEDEKLEDENEKPEAEDEKLEDEKLEDEKLEDENEKPEAEDEKLEDENVKPEAEDEKLEDKNEKPEAEDEKVGDENEKPEVEAEKSEELKEEEPRKEDVVVKIEEVKEKPLPDSQSPTIIKWKIPIPAFLDSIISSLPTLSFWPFNRPSIVANPRISYPGCVLVQE